MCDDLDILMYDAGVGKSLNRIRRDLGPPKLLSAGEFDALVESWYIEFILAAADKLIADVRQLVQMLPAIRQGPGDGWIELSIRVVHPQSHPPPIAAY
jgi:hypothetical protein